MELKNIQSRPRGDTLYILKSTGTTKGDILAFTASATPARLAVGTDGYVLTADSGEATGLIWSAAGAGSGDVVGPASSVDDRIATFDGTTGKLIQDSGSLVSDFATAAEGVTNGDSHNHVGGDGATLDHTDFTSIGTNTHAQIDTHIADSTNPHSVTKTQVSLGNVTDDAQLKRAASDFASFSLKGTPAGSDVLVIEDSADSGNKKYITVGTLPTGGGGESNTASSAGSGTSIFYQKTGIDLEFNAIKSENALLTVALDGVTHDVELTVNEGSIDHDALTNTHNLTTDIDHDQLTNYLASEHFTQAAISIPASQVSDFDTEVSNNGSVVANTAKVTNATHSGDVTGSTVLTIAAGAVDIAMLSATGTPSAATFLRGDNTWAAPAGGGDVTKVGTPVNDQVGVWTGDGTIEGDADLTFDGSNLAVGGNITVGGTVDGIDIATDVAANTTHRSSTGVDHTYISQDVTATGTPSFTSVTVGNTGLTVGSSIPFSDSAGTLTLQNIDALDATTEATIEAAIDTLANLTSVQGHTVTLTGDLIRSGAHSLTLTTTGSTSVTLPTSGTLATTAQIPTVDDTAYNATSWDTNTDAATKNAIRDKFVTNDAAISLNTAKVTNANHTGDATGSTALTIANDAVTYSKMQNVVADDRILGNVSGAGSIVAELTATEVRTMINVADGATANLGDVVGPGSAVDNNLATFDLTTGKLIQDGGATLGIGTNTFSLTRGTASLDIAAGSALDVNANLTVSGVSQIDQDVTSGSAPTFTADNLSDGGGNAIITTTQETNFGAAYTHVSSTGADHTYINQNVTSTGTPSFTSVTATTVNATTLDTNVAAAGVTLAGTTLAADGTDTHIDVTITPKGNAGIVIASTSAPAVTTNKLYNNSGVLTFDGVSLESTGDVTAAAVMTDNTIVKGDGGSKGVQDTGISIDDSDNVTNANTVSFDAEYSNGNSTASFTWTLSNGQQQSVTLNSASVALTISGANVGPGRYMLRVIQDVTGSRVFGSASISGGTVYSPENGEPLVFSTGNGDIDLMWCYYDGTNVYLGVAALDMAAWV